MHAITYILNELQSYNSWWDLGRENALSIHTCKLCHQCLQELRNRLLAEETRRKNALLKLIESTERAKKTRVIGDLVECIDEAIDAGWIGFRRVDAE